MRIALLLFCLSLAAAGCEKTDDRAAIRALVDDLAQRARAHDVNGMMEHASAGFVANPGQRTEREVRPILVLALRRYDKFEIHYPVPGIRLDAERGTATASVPFLVVRQGQQFPAADLETVASDPLAWGARVAELVGDPYQLDLDLERSSDGWKVRKAEIAGFKRPEEL